MAEKNKADFLEEGEFEVREKLALMELFRIFGFW